MAEPSLRRVSIEEATLPQLIDFASVILGLELPPKPTKAAMQALIETAAPGAREIIVVAKLAAPIATLKTGIEAYADLPDDQRVNIVIPMEPGPMGESEVFVGNNGDEIVILRGKEVAIRVKHLRVLMDARKTVWDQAEDGSLIEDTKREVPAFNIQILGLAA